MPVSACGASRVWAAGDRVAIRDRVGARWELGTILAIRPGGWLAIRCETVTGTVRHPDDVRVIPADQVPADEQHWTPRKVRDQLVRQEAAGRLSWVVHLLPAAPLDPDTAAIERLMTRLADVVTPDQCAEEIASVLLGLEPKPAPIPT